MIIESNGMAINNISYNSVEDIDIDKIELVKDISVKNDSDDEKQLRAIFPSYMDYMIIIDSFVQSNKEGKYFVIFKILKQLIYSIGARDFTNYVVITYQNYKNNWYEYYYDDNSLKIEPYELWKMNALSIQINLKSLTDISDCIDYIISNHINLFEHITDQTLLRNDIETYLKMFINVESSLDRKWPESCIITNNNYNYLIIYDHVINEADKQKIINDRKLNYEITMREYIENKDSLKLQRQLIKDSFYRLWNVICPPDYMQYLYVLYLIVEKVEFNRYHDDVHNYYDFNYYYDESAVQLIVDEDNDDEEENSRKRFFFNPNAYISADYITSDEQCVEFLQCTGRNNSVMIQFFEIINKAKSGGVETLNYQTALVNHKLKHKLGPVSPKYIEVINEQFEILEKYEFDHNNKSEGGCWDYITKGMFDDHKIVEDNVVVYEDVFIEFSKLLQKTYNKNTAFVTAVNNFYNDKWKMTYKAFHNLIKPTGWIVDRVIERYIFFQNVYIYQWNDDCDNAFDDCEKEKINVFIFSTVAMQSICGVFRDSYKPYEYCSYITKGVDYINRNGIFEYESLFLVGNEDNKHWYLYEVQQNENLIIIYDPAAKRSQDNLYPRQTNKLIRFLIDEAKNKIIPSPKNDILIKRLTTKQWNVTVSKEMPKQVNSYDCGMYVMLAMDRLIHKIPLSTIFAEAIPSERYRIANMNDISSLYNNNDYSNIDDNDPTK